MLFSIQLFVFSTTARQKNTIKDRPNQSLRVLKSSIDPNNYMKPTLDPNNYMKPISTENFIKISWILRKLWAFLWKKQLVFGHTKFYCFHLRNETKIGADYWTIKCCNFLHTWHIYLFFFFFVKGVPRSFHICYPFVYLLSFNFLSTYLILVF